MLVEEDEDADEVGGGGRGGWLYACAPWTWRTDCRLTVLVMEVTTKKSTYV